MPPHRLVVALVALIVVIGLALGLFGALHGSGSGSKQAQQSADDASVAAQVAATFGTESDLDLTSDQANCVGTSIVKALGTVRASQLGQDTTKPLAVNSAEAGRLADAVLGCVDLRSTIVKGMADQAPISDTSLQCLAARLSKADMKSILVSLFQGDQANDAITQAMVDKIRGGITTCLTPAEQAQVLGPSGG